MKSVIALALCVVVCLAHSPCEADCPDCDSKISIPFERLKPCPSSNICPTYEKPPAKQKCPVPPPCPLPAPCPKPKACPAQPICPPMHKCAVPLPCNPLIVKCKAETPCTGPEYVPVEGQCGDVINVPCHEPCWTPMKAILRGKC